MTKISELFSREAIQKRADEKVQSEAMVKAANEALVAMGSDKTVTQADIDKALENALTTHQRHTDKALVLKPDFAARARALGWVEGVEFVEWLPEVKPGIIAG